MLEVSVERLTSIPVGANPFNHDWYNMGQLIGAEMYLMYSNHGAEECKYLILVDQRTGERVCLDIVRESAIHSDICPCKVCEKAGEVGKCMRRLLSLETPEDAAKIWAALEDGWEEDWACAFGRAARKVLK